MGQAIGHAAGIVQPARRAVAARVSSGHVVMVLAGALGVLLTLSLLRSADDTQPVLVAPDLAPGTIVSDGSFRVARVQADRAVLATLFDEADASALRGQVVVTSVRPGEPLTRSFVRPANAHASARVMSFAIARARAVGGVLVRGDRVDVLAVDKDEARARYVLTDAEIVDVDASAAGALGGVAENVTVTLIVDADQAPKLAVALEAGTVSLVRATGAAPVTGEESS